MESMFKSAFKKSRKSKYFELLPIILTRGGQLFWLGGHFVEAEVGGGPHLLK
jgi:hypothetical protein